MEGERLCIDDWADCAHPSVTPAGLKRREAILCAATRLFAHRGYQGTRVSDIAAASDVNKATLYHYHPSKASLLYDIFRLAASATMAAVELDPTVRPVQAIHECTVNLLRMVARDPHGMAVYTKESPFIAEWLSAKQVESIRFAETTVYRRIADIMDHGVTDGSFRPCDSHILALGYLGMTIGSHRWLTPIDIDSADRIADEIASTFIRGLTRRLADDAASQVRNV